MANNREVMQAIVTLSHNNQLRINEEDGETASRRGGARWNRTNNVIHEDGAFPIESNTIKGKGARSFGYK